MELLLPQTEGLLRPLRPYQLTGKSLPQPLPGGFKSRVAYAAAHVVLDPARTTNIATPVLDWESTLAFRRHLWSLGFGVAEAMDTAQRGMGLDWPLALELIQRSVAEARACNGLIACGAGTDHLQLEAARDLNNIISAYSLQCEAVEAAGGRVILMASRALARVARSSEDYANVYGTILQQLREPVILHWLGPMFDPALTGYWGTNDLHEAMRHCLAVIHDNAAKIDGIKISLLDANLEIEMRRALPPGVRMYTGDDFNYDHLILGDAGSHSDALLGIFDPIGPAAALALQALGAGDTARYNELLAPTIPLARHIFEAPTYNYKTGIVFLAWLNGFQSHFRMVAAAETARSMPHLVKLFELADSAGLLRDPELALQRMKIFLAQEVA
jgi:hypothetical protein